MIRKLTTRMLAVGACAGLFGLTGCASSSGSSGTTAATGDGGPGTDSQSTKICSSIKQADVQALLKGTISSTSADTVQCIYTVDAKTEIVILYFLNDADKSKYNMRTSFPPIHDLTGVGDVAYWNEPVDGESLPQLSAHKGNLTCIVQPPDDPTTTTCPITGDPNAVYQVSASDAAAYVAKMAPICNDFFSGN